jgi:thiol-disulfide isomerase/thioredoxin
MLSIPLGPLALPVAPLLAVASVWLGAWAADRLAVRRAAADATTATDPEAGADARVASPARSSAAGDAPGDALMVAAAAGLVVARIVFVALHADAYAAAPWSMLDVRDGGWHAPSGLAAMLAWLGLRGARRPALRVPMVAGVAVAVVAWLAGSAATGRWDRPSMPDLAVVDLASGRTVTLAEAAAGRPAVVNLWATWCAPCRAEMPVLVDAQRRHEGVAVLLVNQGEPAARVRDFLAREGLAPRQVLRDEGARLGPAVRSGGLPTTLFYDASGRLVDAHMGAITAGALQARLRTLGAGR